MKTIIFDGKEYAKKIEDKVAIEVSVLKKKGILPKLATFVGSSDVATKLYVGLKKKAAERVGIKVEEFTIGLREKAIRQMKVQAIDDEVHGVMVQLPLRSRIRPYTKEVLRAIAIAKDVDGLREESNFLPATVRAVLEILTYASEKTDKKLSGCKFVVVGAEGVVGKSLVKKLKELRYEVTGLDKETTNLASKTIDADVIVTATGKPRIIKGDMVKEGVIVIDVGAPRGDVDFDSVSSRASFITPVPGGVGPVTVASLLQNIVDAAKGL